MKEFDWSDGEREALRSLRSGVEWDVVQKILDYANEKCLYAYRFAKENHSFYQGKWHGILEIMEGFEQLSKPKSFQTLQDRPPGFGVWGRRKDMPNDF